MQVTTNVKASKLTTNHNKARGRAAALTLLLLALVAPDEF